MSPEPHTPPKIDKTQPWKLETGKLLTTVSLLLAVLSREGKLFPGFDKPFALYTVYLTLETGGLVHKLHSVAGYHLNQGMAVEVSCSTFLYTYRVQTESNLSEMQISPAWWYAAHLDSRSVMSVGALLSSSKCCTTPCAARCVGLIDTNCRTATLWYVYIISTKW